MKCEPDEDDPFSFEGPEIISTSGYLFIYCGIILLEVHCIFAAFESGNLFRAAGCWGWLSQYSELRVFSLNSVRLCAVVVCEDNSPFQNYFVPLFQNKSLCSAFCMKWLWFTWKGTGRQNTFSYELFTFAQRLLLTLRQKGNSEMTYLLSLKHSPVAVQMET